jgi:hypothetical protein
MTEPIHTVDTLQQLNFKVLEYIPCVPDMAPPIITCLLHFTSDQQVKEAVHAWLVSQTTAQKLVAWCSKCIEN